MIPVDSAVWSRILKRKENNQMGQSIFKRLWAKAWSTMKSWIDFMKASKSIKDRVKQSYSNRINNTRPYKPSQWKEN